MTTIANASTVGALRPSGARRSFVKGSDLFGGHGSMTAPPSLKFGTTASRQMGEGAIAGEGAAIAYAPLRRINAHRYGPAPTPVGTHGYSQTKACAQLA